MVRDSRPEHCLTPFGDRRDNEVRNVPKLCLYQLARIFGKFLANGFLSEGTASGKSENDLINTGELWWAILYHFAPRCSDTRRYSTLWNSGEMMTFSTPSWPGGLRVRFGGVQVQPFVNTLLYV